MLIFMFLPLFMVIHVGFIHFAGLLFDANVFSCLREPNYSVIYNVLVFLCPFPLFWNMFDPMLTWSLFSLFSSCIMYLFLSISLYLIYIMLGNQLCLFKNMWFWGCMKNTIELLWFNAVIFCFIFCSFYFYSLNPFSCFSVASFTFSL